MQQTTKLEYLDSTMAFIRDNLVKGLDQKNSWFFLLAGSMYLRGSHQKIWSFHWKCFKYLYAQ